MFYKYRVTLAGIKGFYRVYLLSGENSLYTFYKQLSSDLEFPLDQPILFKALDEAGGVVARYALTDIGYGTVDTVSVSDTIKAGVASFVYFYDVTLRKSVIITLEGDVPTPVAIPTLVDVKGPVPREFENGYVAFEDLPEEHPRIQGGPGDDDDDDDDDDKDKDKDDDEEEEDEEDPDKEEEEIIYDENEAA